MAFRTPFSWGGGPFILVCTWSLVPKWNWEMTEIVKEMGDYKMESLQIKPRIGEY